MVTESRKLAAKRYRESHRDETNARSREAKRRWRAENPEADRAAQRAYFEANRERIRENQRARRARLGPRRVDPVINRGYRLMHKHGMTLDDWAALRDAQEGKCYLCEDPLPEQLARIHIDHDHSCCPAGYSCTSCRRGLACHRCNVLIGNAGDDADRLARILANLVRRIGTDA